MTPLQRRLLQWYRRHGRFALPWRTRRDPYYTVVSEFMLSQTQVDRVVPRFEAFIRRFPTFQDLAKASPADVVRQWQGLGYNVRAVRVHALARAVVERHGGELPSEIRELRALPGIGPYTAAAIRAFGFDLDDAPVDTNVRRIVNRFFGLDHPHDARLRERDARARSLMPEGLAHDWNSAMMDLGAAICTARTPKCLLCPLRPDCVSAPIDAAALERLRRFPTKQKPAQQRIAFEETTRYVRGRIIDRLRELSDAERISLLDLHRALFPLLRGRSLDELGKCVTALERDGLVTRDGAHLALRE